MEEELEAGGNQVRLEFAAFVDEIANSGRRQRRPAVDQNDVQADAEFGKAARSFDGVFERGGCDHEARRAEDALAVGTFDSFVDFRRDSEVVAGDDELSQWGSFSMMPQARSSAIQMRRPSG